MDCKAPRPMTPFDELVTPPHLYTLKLILPYTPPSAQRMLGIYVKFQEFKNTLEHFQGFHRSDSGSILDELKNFMKPEEREMMEQMKMFMNMMEMAQNMQAAPEDSDENPQNNSGFQPMDLMKNMLNPEQQEMFDMYSSIFDNEILASADTQEGKENNHG